jgi:hypothetical protein
VGWEIAIYYFGYVIVLALCRGLGPVFFYPTLANVLFDVCLYLGFFSGWDVRWLIATYGCAVLVWVLVLTGVTSKPVFLALLALDATIILHGTWPLTQVAGTGQDFWNATSTSIFHVWLSSIAVVVWSGVFQSTIGAKLKGKSPDLLRNPRKRYVIPLGMWATISVGFYYIAPFIPEWLVERRFVIGGHCLVWAWIAFELPQYMMYKRLRRMYP